jgi:hypothetical protein
MAISLAQSVIDTGLGSAPQASSISVTAGHSLVVVARWHTTAGAPDITSITLTNENNLTLAGGASTITALNEGLRIAYLPVIASTGTKTITLNLGSTGVNCSMSIFELVGANTPSLLDSFPTPTNGSSTGGSISITTNKTGDFVIAVGNSAAAPTTFTNGYTNINPTGVWVFDNIQYILNAGAAGTQNCTIGWGGTTEQWNMLGASFLQQQAHSVSMTLDDINGNILSNLSNLHWSWWDAADVAVITTPPVNQGNTAVTNSSGLLTVTLANTSLATGQYGILALHAADWTRSALYVAAVT